MKYDSHIADLRLMIQRIDELIQMLEFEKRSIRRITKQLNRLNDTAPFPHPDPVDDTPTVGTEVVK